MNQQSVRFLATIIFLLMIFTSCKKSASKIDENLIGEWVGNYSDSPGEAKFEFNISGVSSFWHRKFSGTDEAEEFFNGAIEGTKKHFKIGGAPKFGKFDFIELPKYITDTVVLHFELMESDTFNEYWIMKVSYPNSIGYDGRDVTFYKH